MRLIDGCYECAVCGAVLDIPGDEKPRVVIKSTSGKPHMRAIIYDGVEIHACPVGREPRAGADASR